MKDKELTDIGQQVAKEGDRKAQAATKGKTFLGTEMKIFYRGIGVAICDTLLRVGTCL